MSRVSEVCQASSHSVGVDIPIRTARELMRKFDMRYLPVLRGGNLVGVIAARDIDLIEGTQNRVQDYVVEDLMDTEPLVRRMEDELDEVVEDLLSQQKDVAVIQDRNGKVAGILDLPCVIRAWKGSRSQFDRVDREVA